MKLFVGGVSLKLGADGNSLVEPMEVGPYGPIMEENSPLEVLVIRATIYFSDSAACTLLQGGLYIECAFTALLLHHIYENSSLRSAPGSPLYL